MGAEGDVPMALPSRSRTQRRSETVAHDVAPALLRTGKGKARAVDVDIDVDTDVAATQDHQAPLPPALPRPPLFRPPLAPPLSALSGGPSPSASFARLSLTSPHPGARGPRPSWFSVGVGVGVEVRAHGEAPDLHTWKPEEEESMPAEEAMPAAADSPTPPVAPATPPRVHFVEPVKVVVQNETRIDNTSDIASQYLDDDYKDAILLGPEEPYRPSWESPSPAPHSDE
ncbi:hypothetical protein B0H13DRAFT_1886030 [Mycena leptocephala]|nr:hypothetical protein B0H13DRAFT_1886030 [Mycena leptocephala]